MKKILVFGLTVVFMAACSESPTQPMDVDAQFGVNGNGNGAMVWNGGGNFDDCYENWYYTYCYDEQWTMNRVQTPSGNYKYTFNSHGDWTYDSDYYGSTYSETGEYKNHNNFLIKKGETHRRSWSNQQSWSNDYQTCSYTNVYHFANGEVTKNIYDYTCTDN